MASHSIGIQPRSLSTPNKHVSKPAHHFDSLRIQSATSPCLSLGRLPPSANISYRRSRIENVFKSLHFPTPRHNPPHTKKMYHQNSAHHPHTNPPPPTQMSFDQLEQGLHAQSELISLREDIVGPPSPSPLFFPLTPFPPAPPQHHQQLTTPQKNLKAQVEALEEALRKARQRLQATDGTLQGDGGEVQECV